MTRAAAIAAVQSYFDKGGFVADLARRVAIPAETQVEADLPTLRTYLADEIAPSLARGVFSRCAAFLPSTAVKLRLFALAIEPAVSQPACAAPA